MSTKTSSARSSATAQEKRRQTLERKKLQEQAQLRALESAGKQKRAALTKALGNAAWIGNAPVGSQKRPRSPNGAQGGKPTKKAKGSPNTSTKSMVTPRRPLTKKQCLPPSHRRTAHKENIPDEARVESSGLSASKRLHKASTYRRIVGVVNSDDEPPEEDEAMDAPQDRDSDEDEDGDQGDFEDEDEAGVQNDLEDLDSDALKSRLAHERVQWGREYGAHEDNEPDQQDNDDDDHEDNEPDQQDNDDDDHPHSADRGEHLDYDDGEHLDYDDEGQEEDEDLEEAEKKVTKGRKKIGKRGLERRAEQPTWKATATNEEELFDSANSDNDMDDDGDEDQEQGEDVDPNANWEHARYVPEAPGARLISIRMQPPPLRQIIRAAIRQVIGDAIFDNAYPSANDELTYYRKTLRSCARKLKYEGYAERFKKDLQFGIIIARLLNGRLSSYRGSVKHTAAKKVEGFYQLLEGAECREQVKDLCEDTSYIFPTKNGEIVSNKPFHHPAVISTLRDVYFAGTRGSLAERYTARFSSSITEGPRKYERELPDAMVALAATGIHASLDDFSSGGCQKAEFMADLYEDVYIGHLTFLNNIKEESPDRYHRLMANLFNLAAAVATRRSTALTNNAMALLNLADMEV